MSSCSLFAIIDRVACFCSCSLVFLLFFYYLVLFFVLELLFFDIVVCYKFVTSSLILSLFVVLCA